MTQSDFIIENQTPARFRLDVQDALRAGVSNSIGATAPRVTYSGQFWYDVGNNILKIRNEDNNAWIQVIKFDSETTPNGLLGLPTRYDSSTSYTKHKHARISSVEYYGAGGGGAGSSNGSRGGLTSFHSQILMGGAGGAAGSTTAEGRGGAGGLGTGDFAIIGATGDPGKPNGSGGAGGSGGGGAGAGGKGATGGGGSGGGGGGGGYGRSFFSASQIDGMRIVIGVGGPAGGGATAGQPGFMIITEYS